MALTEPLIVTRDTSLSGYNTFGMDVATQCLVEVTMKEQLPVISGDTSLPKPIRILGGGSNVLLTDAVEGTVILNRIGGIEVVREDVDYTWVSVGAGVVWHNLVLYAIEHKLGGIENLALIPGSVGAAPIQNIGAYGVEVKDTITEVEVWDWEANDTRRFSNEECRFGYRDSVFKRELKDRIVVTAVTFKLSKHPVLRTEYGAIRDELTAIGAEPSVQTIAQAVINIRRSKLPDPTVIGNAGSFFKNPTIGKAQFEQLRLVFSAMPSYPAGNEMVKLPAGWLIEQCGWKGYRKGDAGVHAKQALVLVNYGHADGAQIWQLSEEVVQSVHTKFGIELEREVQVW
jgi:UDP-N-acetylmuramate dehydrogenase